MTQTFPAWLTEQQGRDDEVGVLAREVASLDDFPDSGGKAIYDGYFETTQKSSRDHYERAWSEFQASPEPSSTSDDPDGLRTS